MKQFIPMLYGYSHPNQMTGIHPIGKRQVQDTASQIRQRLKSDVAKTRIFYPPGVDGKDSAFEATKVLLPIEWPECSPNLCGDRHNPYEFQKIDEMIEPIDDPVLFIGYPQLFVGYVNHFAQTRDIKDFDMKPLGINYANAIFFDLEKGSYEVIRPDLEERLE